MDYFPNKSEPTVADVLYAGASWIEKYGWANLAKPELTADSAKCACVVTSIVYVLPYHTKYRDDVLETFAREIGITRITHAGVEVGMWNDNQRNAEAVVAKMREVADKLQ